MPNLEKRKTIAERPNWKTACQRTVGKKRKERKGAVEAKSTKP
jgi:hypothetical protein